MTSDLQRARDLAWAEAFAGGARVLSTLSTRLRQMYDTPGAPEAVGAVVADSRAGVARSAGPAARRHPEAGHRTRTPRGGYGPRQQQLLALPGLDTETGLSAGEAARALGLTPPNAHGLLVRLEDLEALERVHDVKPARWRRSG